MEITLSEAKAKLSELVNKVAAGEVITVTRHGKPVLELRDPNVAAKRKALYGSLKGKAWIADDFDETPPEVLEAIEKGIDPDE